MLRTSLLEFPNLSPAFIFLLHKKINAIQILKNISMHRYICHFLLPTRIGNRAFLCNAAFAGCMAIGGYWEGLGRLGSIWEYLGFQYCRIGFRRIRGLYGEYSLLR